MKSALLKKALRLLVELAVLCTLFLLGGQIASWLGWPIPGGVMGLLHRLRARLARRG